ncbi:hypothetical protein HYX11_04515 [Candidatus Woesearchaeota archaeon]|nr:hypothetical protein [Candidatus Woesearchaeota archaeon]
MSNKRLIPLLLLTIFLTISVIPFTLAEQDKEVKVGVYLLNLGKYEVATGSFTVDFYLSLKCNYNCSPENFEFMNGRASSVDLMENKPSEKFYRIQANLNSKVDLKKFPFDKQEINIILEDKENTNAHIKYIPNIEESGIDPSITFTGWNIDGWRAEERDHNYPIYNETYSQYTFTIDLSRILINSFLKTILPVFFILLTVLFSFIIDPDKVTTRLSMSGSSLVAAVMFHVSISNQIPPVSYLTFSDKFLGLTYLVLLLSFIINISLIELQERKNHELLMKIHRLTEFSMLIIVPLLYLALFLLFL